jgi:hypothetical protein
MATQTTTGKSKIAGRYIGGLSNVSKMARVTRIINVGIRVSGGGSARPTSGQVWPRGVS